jgi:hypothetical protein
MPNDVQEIIGIGNIKIRTYLASFIMNNQVLGQRQPSFFLHMSINILEIRLVIWIISQIPRLHHKNGNLRKKKEYGIIPLTLLHHPTSDRPHS